MAANEHGKAEHLSADDMRSWLGEEIRNVLKECELRVRDATAFTTAYAAGELTPKEAHKRLSRYGERWHDPLNGIQASSYKTDDQILAAMDKAGQSRRSFLEKVDRKAARSRGSEHDR